MIQIPILDLIHRSYAFTKVLVPSVYNEWTNHTPEWATSAEIMNKYNYSVFLYQKLDPNKPNYIQYNTGREASVYFRYIVDFYDNFPDVAIFVHAKPHEHQKKWLKMIGCISPTANYINFNFQNMYRSTHYW
jgi:hypothetical protein